MPDNIWIWQRHDPRAYECSSHGDRRFSAFNALLPDGRSIEQHYQCDIKGYQPGGTNWRLGKGKPHLLLKDPSAQWEAYLALWREWAKSNQPLLDELDRLASPWRVLSDKFATSPINQAHALSVLMNERRHQRSTP